MKTTLSTPRFHVTRLCLLAAGAAWTFCWASVPSATSASAASQSGFNPNEIPILVQVIEGPENILALGGRLALCVPSSFLITDPQPILRNVDSATGFCDDAPFFSATSIDGVIVFEADTNPPFDVTILPGTNAEFFPDGIYFSGEVSCDSFPVELLPQPPCEFVSVRIVEDASFWTVSDASGVLEFTTTGDAPVARAPEPGFASALFLGSLALAGHKFEKKRKQLE